MAAASPHGVASTKPTWGRKLLFAIVGYVSAALALSFAWVAVRSGNGDASWFGIVIGWTMVILLLFGGVGGAIYATRVLLNRDPWTEITEDEIRLVRSGQVLRNITLSDAVRVSVLLGRRTTLSGPRGELDSTPDASRQRLNTELVVEGRGEPIVLGEGPGWNESVAMLRRWLRARPDLAQDEDTRAFFAVK